MHILILLGIRRLLEVDYFLHGFEADLEVDDHRSNHVEQPLNTLLFVG